MMTGFVWVSFTYYIFVFCVISFWLSRGHKTLCLYQTRDVMAYGGHSVNQKRRKIKDQPTAMSQTLLQAGETKEWIILILFIEGVKEGIFTYGFASRMCFQIYWKWPFHYLPFLCILPCSLKSHLAVVISPLILWEIICGPLR